MSLRSIIILSAFTLVSTFNAKAQQVTDTSYYPEIASPVYESGTGTRIYIDEAHENFHTRDGGYAAFAKVLSSDGYRVERSTEKFSNVVLEAVEILVIANAESEGVTHPIVAPTRSAFSDAEIEAVEEWVRNGGNLFLIADHMPFAGAAAPLAKAFGFEFYDGFAMRGLKNGTIDFKIKDGTLSDHFITNGRSEKERVTKVRSFTGQGFEMPETAESILNLTDQTIYLTDTMWVINESVRHFSAQDLSQGAVMNYGKGKLAIFGEAAMFSAQLVGKSGRKAGMNTPEADQNYKLLLNIIHWLDGKLEP